MDWKVGMRRLMPGVYVDRSMAMHIDYEELLVAHGFADTPANRAMVEREIREVLPFAEVTRVMDVDDS